MVEQSSTTLSALSCEAAPLAPNSTSSTAASSLTQSSSTSTPLLASAGLEHGVAPSSSGSVSAVRLRECTRSGKPARLGDASTANDPLTQMREGMAALAERDAERQLAGLLQGLVA